VNYSDKIKFDHWIESCPIDDVQVQPTTSMVRNGNGKWSYLVKVFLTIDKEDWDNNTPEEEEHIDLSLEENAVWDNPEVMEDEEEDE